MVPHGWVTRWPASNGGWRLIFSPGPTKPDYGAELNAALKIYPVFTETTQTVDLDDEEIDKIDQGMCGEREFAVVFARDVIDAHERKNGRK